MTQTNPAQRINQLVKLINQYNYEYHVLDNPSVDDAVWDSLMAELKQLEQKHPNLITPESPTQRVGDKQIDGFVKKEHKKRILSLNDVFSLQEVKDWYKRIIKLDERVTKSLFWGDIKMDGLSCALWYKDGALEAAVTRGDGFVGEDVTNNVKVIPSVPLSLKTTKDTAYFATGYTEVRGEIVMYKKDFIELNKIMQKNGEKLYANPRNLAAGTIRQLDPSIVAKRRLYFRPFDMLREDPGELKTQQQTYKALADMQFLVNSQAKLLNNINEIEKFAEYWKDKRQDLPFNTDGLVIKINNRELYDSLGVVGKNPRAAVAFKYPAITATTKIVDIIISIGRTGAATPVAVLEPVFLAGSTVQMATLHNQQEIAKKDIKIGDTVVVQKAGDIIPEVIEPIVGLRTGSEKPFVMPKECPDCQTTLKKPSNEVVWRCPNSRCPARTWRHIQHFASKPALNIDGLGEKNVMVLLDNGLISDSADLYKLTKDQIIKLERFADLSADNLVKAISAKKNPPLSKFIFALGIRHVGAQTAIDISNKYKTLDAITNTNLQDLLTIDGVGEVVAESVVTWFSDPANIKLLKKFADNDVIPKNQKESVNGPLAGKSFVITGSLNSMSRQDAADKIISLGGTFQSSVGKGTTYLVANNDVGTSKLAKAQKFGTKIIKEEDFIKLINA